MKALRSFKVVSLFLLYFVVLLIDENSSRDRGDQSEKWEKDEEDGYVVLHHEYNLVACALSREGKESSRGAITPKERQEDFCEC